MIDIIIPAYNAHNTIKKTLASIAMQEISNEIKVTIVDDCSDIPYDDIANLFSSMLNIQIVKMSKNGGPGVARQVGFDHTKEEFVMWMDADDTLVSAVSIKVLRDVIVNGNHDCAYGKFLEETDNGTMVSHEIHMVWMFGKLYRRSFLERYNIRFNISRQNEDTGFNTLVRECTEKIWYIPEPVYIWHFKENSITRIKDAMYGFESGYKGYIDNMMWQILECEKRFINKNKILSNVVSIMCILYFFHVENTQKYPMNTPISINWIRGYYYNIYKRYEEFIDETLFNQIFCAVQRDQNIAQKNIIPKVTINQFMDIIKEETYKEDIMEETRGSTPAGYIPETTPTDWPVDVSKFEYSDNLLDIDDDTNKPLYEGMNKVIR